MKKRYEYAPSAEGYQSALAQKCFDGGRIVVLERLIKFAWIIENIYWYAPDYTLTDIDADISRKWTSRASIE